MSNPQVENGFTRISNELYEAILFADFSKTEYKIIFALIRRSYGFHKSECELSLRFLSKIINIEYNNLSKPLKNLMDKNVIIEIKHSNYSEGRIVKINKNYQNWIGFDSYKFYNCYKNYNNKSDNINNSKSYETNNNINKYIKKPLNRVPHFDKVLEFAEKMAIPADSAKKFYLYNNAHGWESSYGNKIKDWGSALQYWFLNENKKQTDNIGQTQQLQIEIKESYPKWDDST